MARHTMKIQYTCSICNNTTHNAQMESTRLDICSEDQDYGSFNITIISRRTSGSNATVPVTHPNVEQLEVRSPLLKRRRIVKPRRYMISPDPLPAIRNRRPPVKQTRQHRPQIMLPPLAQPISPHRPQEVVLLHSAAPETDSPDTPTHQEVSPNTSIQQTAVSHDATFNISLPSFQSDQPNQPTFIIGPAPADSTTDPINQTEDLSSDSRNANTSTDVTNADAEQTNDTHTSSHSNASANLTASFDVTRRPVEDPPEAIKESMQEPELLDRIVPDAPVTYSLVDQGSQRGRIKLVSSNGYEYTKKVSKGDFTYWRCVKRAKGDNCPATVSQKGSDFKTNARQHTHQADKGALKNVVLKKEVKAESLRDVHKPARRIVEDAMLEHIQPGDHQLPKVKNLERLVNRVREDLRPEEPKDLDFILDTEYLQCQQFLVGDLHVDDQRHLLFATPDQLQILQRAKRWFCDGTFKILADPFEQLWSIHAFIRKGDSYKQVPLLVCLMSRRKGKDYIAVFQRLKEVLPDAAVVQNFVADFEKSVWKAIRKEFPNTVIKGCAFHFGQAIWRKIQDLGLKTTYSSRGPEYRYMRSLMSLPFLPSADIQPAFDNLSSRATSTELQDLVNYIDSTWMDATQLVDLQHQHSDQQ